MANMIKNCKSSVNNGLINKQSQQNKQYRENILKKSKRILNPHL